MALIECPDCGRQVSDVAPACPGCGRPMHATVIEQTNKSIKAVKLVGGLIFFLGLPALLFNMSLGVTLVIIGLVIYVTASFARWWNHG